MNVSLTDDLRAFVRNKVESGPFPSEEAVLLEALQRFREDADPAGIGTEDLADGEAGAACARRVEGREVPSIEEVRRGLAGIAGSMAKAVIEERGERVESGRVVAATHR